MRLQALASLPFPKNAAPLPGDLNIEYTYTELFSVVTAARANLRLDLHG